MFLPPWGPLHPVPLLCPSLPPSLTTIPSPSLFSQTLSLSVSVCLFVSLTHTHTHTPTHTPTHTHTHTLSLSLFPPPPPKKKKIPPRHTPAYKQHECWSR
ncbi:hypothetical protein KP509_1Z176200 [Ceratopteris richardii]|nr:hypothetical protein KP509_1Z176200 [Ceratopteris richardii]